MEIFGGFIVMMSIISLFLAVAWLVMPFLIFAVKEKQEKTLKLLEMIEKRLTDLEVRVNTPLRSQTIIESDEIVLPIPISKTPAADNNVVAVPEPTA